MSNKNRIGSKITLDGEADFNKAIKNINNTMRLLRSEAKKNTQEFALNKDQLGYCTSQYSTLSRTMDEQRNKVAIIQKALEDATKQYGENSDAVRKWRTDLNYAQGDLAKTSASLNEMRETLDSADETNFKEAVLKIDDSLSILNSNMKKNSAVFLENKDQMALWTAQGKTLSESAEKQQEKIELIKTALQKASEKFGDSSEQVRSWTLKLNNAEAELAKTNAKLNETKEELEKVKEKKPETAIEKFGASLKNVHDKLETFKEKINVFDKLKNKLNDAKERFTYFRKGASEAGDSLEEAGKKSIKFGDLIKAHVISDIIVNGLKSVASACKSIAKGVFDFVKESVAGFGELEQNLGGSAAVFGSYADAVVEKSKSAYKNMGVAQSEYLATANKMGSLFQGSGLSQERSLELTTKAMQRATDVASVMGIDTSQALESIAGAAKGNFTMMDNLGVAMNATTLEAYAAGKGINFVWNKASNAEKAELAMQMFFEKTEQYAGNFAREAESTLTGSIGMTKAAMQTLKENLGNSEADLEPMIMNLLNSVKAIVRNAAPVVQNIINAILEQTPSLLNAGAQMVNSLLDGLVSNLAPILSGAVDVVFTLVDGIVANLDPIMQAAVTLIVVLVGALADNIDKVIDAAFTLVDSLVNALLQDDNLSKILNSAVRLVIEISTGLIANVPRLIPAAFQLIGGIVKGLWDNKGLVVDAIVKVCKAMLEGFKNFFGIHSPSTVFAGLGKNLLEGLWNGIKNMKDWLIRKIKSLGSAVTDAMKSVLGIHSPSTVFRDQIGKNMALGVGVGFETTMRDVAKRMTDSIPMDVDINATGNFTARRAQAAVSGGNKVYNFNVTINAADGGGDVRALASRIAEEIYDEMRRKERAYA
nr:MAG TPA: tail tape measure protein [Caudoviricetes sp.]